MFLGKLIQKINKLLLSLKNIIIFIIDKINIIINRVWKIIKLKLLLTFKYIKILLLKGFKLLRDNPQIIINIFIIVINIFLLIIAIRALDISRDTLKNSKEQFERNQKSADSIFKIQLINAKANNDSIILQLEAVKKLTDKQINIINKLLFISNQTLKDQIYADRPILIMEDRRIEDLDKRYENKFSPKITTVFKNVGKRNATDIIFRWFIIYNQKYIRTNKPEVTKVIQPNTILSSISMPKIDTTAKDDFYYCFDITYSDSYNKEKYYHCYYTHYQKVRNIFDFYDCSNDIIEILKNNINTFLNKYFKYSKPFDK